MASGFGSVGQVVEHHHYNVGGSVVIVEFIAGVALNTPHRTGFESQIPFEGSLGEEVFESTL